METFPTPADLTLTFSSYGRILINANIAREESALTFKAYGHPFTMISSFLSPGADPDRDRQHLTGGHRKTLEGEMYMVMPIMDHWVGGGIPTDLGVVLLGGGPPPQGFFHMGGHYPCF